MRLLGILALVIMVSVGGAVGLRLVRLGRRTGQLPERSLGTGLIAITAGGAVAGLSRAPGFVGSDLGDALLAGSLGVVVCGISFFYFFTWRVFRLDRLWAMWGVAIAIATLGCLWLGLMHATVTGGDTMEEILPHTRPWGIGVIGVVVAGFAWSGVESALTCARLRRQLAIGLGDRVLMNRFLLWSVSDFAVVIVCSAMAASMAAGLAPMRHPLPLWCVGTASIVVSVTWTLTFMPPQRYLDWVAGAAPPA